MQVFELKYPGVVLILEDLSNEVNLLLSRIRQSFTETVVAYNLFLNEQNIDLVLYKETYEERVKSVQQSLSSQELFNTDKWTSTYLEAKKSVWSEGLEPLEYLMSKKFIFANAFVFGLDNIYKQICKLSEYQNIPSEVNNSKTLIGRTYPYLVEIRNSIHHIEDRIRKVAKNRNGIKIKPIENGFISGTNALIIGSLNGNKYSYTLANGSLGEISIDESTVTFFKVAFKI